MLFSKINKSKHETSLTGNKMRKKKKKENFLLFGEQKHREMGQRTPTMMHSFLMFIVPLSNKQ